MRLLKTSPTSGDRLETEEFIGSDVPPYAILSHTWESGEVLYADLKDAEVAKSKKGYDKIRMTLAQAHKDGLEYAWVDTWFDASNIPLVEQLLTLVFSAAASTRTAAQSSARPSTPVSIANSSGEAGMLTEFVGTVFEWYANARTCYVFLSDLIKGADDASSSFSKCRWFTRGWTLQELLAPASVRFYDKDWAFLGSKCTSSLSAGLQEATGIEPDYLLGRRALGTASVAKRMSWASHRITTRVEDIAYCLFGIFGVNMPMLYGEGEKAFIRLQEQILASSDDQTLFAWKDSPTAPREFCGLLALSPTAFAKTGHMIPYAAPQAAGRRDAHAMTNKGLYMELDIRPCSPEEVTLPHCQSRLLATLECMAEYDNNYVCVQLAPTGESPNHFQRCLPESLFSLPSPLPTRRGIYVRQRETGLRRAQSPFHYIQYTGWSRRVEDDNELEVRWLSDDRAAEIRSRALWADNNFQAVFIDLIGHQGSWVQTPDRLKTIAIPKGTGMLSAYIIVTVRALGDAFVLLIGSDQSWRLAFDITETVPEETIPGGRARAETNENVECLPLELRNSFNPRPPGEVLALEGLDVIVDVIQDHGVFGNGGFDGTCRFSLRLFPRYEKGDHLGSKVSDSVVTRQEWDGSQEDDA